MSGRSWRWAATRCCLVVAVVTGACDSASSIMPVPLHHGGPGRLLVLQANLCGSGIADCYTGRAVAEAMAIIRSERPDIVTLNEVCRDDVSVLKQALSAAEQHSVVASAFKAAVQPHVGGPVRCRNGQQYGIGLLARIQPPDRGYTTSGARYPVQDPTDTEQRVWLCVHAIGHFYACTTHLTSAGRAVALGQCRYLMNVAIPAARTAGGNDPVILGADLNLSDDRPPSVQSCTPPGFVRTDDGGTQYVVVSAPLAITGTRAIDMNGTTDHPSLLADLARLRRD